MKSGCWCLGAVLVLAGCEARHGAGEPGEAPDPAAAAETGAGPAATDPPAAADEPAGWVSMVPEEGNGAWKALEFGGDGPAGWKDGVLHLAEGAELTGMLWTGDLPVAPYEIELEARRTSGSDFFCGLTVPVRSREVCVTLVVGGWGGGLMGVSCIGWMDASENETTTFHEFENNRWYKVRMVVEQNRLRGWLGDELVFDVDTTDRELSLRSGAIEDAAPLSLTSYVTRAELRGIRWRRLP